MSAIEYGSYYWCVVLRETDVEKQGSSIHLHADNMSIDDRGNLIFRSAGRRPAGTEPKKQQDSGSDASPGEQGEKHDNGNSSGNGHNSGNGEMIYFAVASNAWKLAYAAKLQDGTPAVVEHWTDDNGRESLPSVVPVNAGARELPPGVVK